MSRKRDLYDRFLAHLREAATHRAERQELVITNGQSELGWVLYERRELHTEVNRARAERSMAPIELAAVEAVERLAEGHIDYAEKFALYCAELVTTKEWRP